MLLIFYIKFQSSFNLIFYALSEQDKNKRRDEKKVLSGKNRSVAEQYYQAQFQLASSAELNLTLILIITTTYQTPSTTHPWESSI